MAARSRIQIAKDDIFQLFEDADQKVYTKREISAVLSQNRDFWRLAMATSTGPFIDFLQKHGKLRPVRLVSEDYDDLTRYVWGEPSPYQLALAIRKRSYLCHGTAVFLHGLTDLIPKTIYANAEQSSKGPHAGTASLTQERVDMAFSREQRRSRYVFTALDRKMVVLSGKNTGRLDVEPMPDPSGNPVDVTRLERTLVDIVVRPNYAGGVFNVLDAYRAAKNQVSTNHLRATLKRLDYAYPYQQSIGFLMERAGYSESQYKKFLPMVSQVDFYLAHGMRETEYDKKWRLFFPKGL